MATMFRRSRRIGLALLSVVWIAAAGAASAAEWRKAAALSPVEGVEAVQVSVESDLAAGSQRLVYKVPAPVLQPTRQRVRQNGAKRVIMGNAERSIAAVGKPVIPAIPCWVMLPQGHTLKDVEVKFGKPQNLEGSFTLEYGETCYRLSDPGPIEPATPDASVYDADDVYPPVRYKVNGVHVKQGVRYVCVVIYPLEYRPQSGRVTHFPSVAVNVTSEPDPAATVDTRFSPKAEVFARSFCDNASTISTYAAPERPSTSAPRANTSPTLPAQGGVTYNYVIITSIQFRDMQAAPNLWDLVAAKGTRDVVGTVVTVEDIAANYAGRDNAERVRTFIRDAYNNWGTEFVLLGGDVNVVPLRTLYCESHPGGFGYTDQIPSDLYYQCLDGSFDGDGDSNFGEVNDGVDLFAEVAIGRASAQNPDEMVNWVYKTLRFEAATEAQAYTTNNLLVGEHLGFGGISEYAKSSMEEIRLGAATHGMTTAGFATTLANGNTWASRTMYDADMPSQGIPGNAWREIDLKSRINSNKFSVINHLGHCDTGYWARMVNGDENDLVNTNFVFIYSQGCYPGNFEADCMGERLTTSTRYGMFAVVFNSRYGWGALNSTDGPSQRFHRNFWHAYFEGIDIDGVAVPDARLGKMNAFSHETQAWRIDEDMMRWCYYESNLLGDPETAIKGLSTPSSITLDQLAYRSDAVVGIAAIDADQDPDIATNRIGFVIGTRLDAGIGAQHWLRTDLGLFRVDDEVRYTNSVAMTSGVTASEGDLLAVSFTSLGGDTYTDTAMIDDTPPVITNARVAWVSEDAITVEWYTDEPADSAAVYGDAPPLMGGTWVRSGRYVDTPTLVNGENWYRHEVTLTGLQSLHTYYIGVMSTDYAGNTSTDPDLTSTDENDYLFAVTQGRLVAYEDSFDTVAAGWTVTNIRGAACWEFGVPTYYPNSAYTGTRCWVTDLDGRYANLVNAALVSPPIYVKNQPRITFWTWYDIVAGFLPGDYRDAGFVEVNTGTGWVNVTPRSRDVVGVGFQGSSFGWTQVTIDLPEISNAVMQVRFRLEADDSMTAGGWAIDDLAITHLPDAGLQLLSYTFDDSVGGDGDGYAEPGEQIDINLAVFNSSDTVAFTNVTGEVGASAPGVTPTLFARAKVAYGDILPGKTVSCVPPVRVTLDPSVPSGSVIPFTQSLTDSKKQRWTQTFTLKVAGRASISGQVTVQGTGTPIQGATVTGVLPDGTVIETTSAADGSYKLEGNYPGEETVVRAKLPGVYSPSADQSVVAPATGVDFELGGVAIADIAPSAVNMTVAQGGTVSMTLDLSNTNALATVPLAYELSVEYAGFVDGWLTVGPGTGLVPAGDSATISVTAGSEQLFLGTHFATIWLRSNDVGGDDIAIPVAVTVEEAAELFLVWIDVIDTDGDGFLEPGETADLHFTLLNNGSADARGLTGTLSAQTPGVSIIQPNVAFPDILQGLTGESDPDATVQASAAGEVYEFTLRVTDTNDVTWSLPFTLGVGERWTVSGTVTGAGPVPVPGVEVRAMPESGSLVYSGVTDATGAYVIKGLPTGDYRIVALPPAPYDSPAARLESVTGDLTGIDFTVADWGMVVVPTAINEQVEFAREAQTTLLVRNGGTTDGQVTFEIKHKRGVSRPDALAGRSVSALPKVNWAALRDEDHAPGQVIVSFKDDRSRAAGKRALRARGMRIVKEFKLIPAVVAEYNAVKLAAGVLAADLENESSIVRVEPNVKLSFNRLPNDTFFSDLYGMRNRRQTGGTLGADINAEKAWDITVGDTNVVVAVIDSGVDITHDDLAANIWTNRLEVYGDGVNDMMPGLPGVDDDGDALATAESNTVDGVDNDGDGMIDEDGIDLTDEDVMTADYDGDSVFLYGPDPNPADFWVMPGDGTVGTLDDDFHDTYLASYDEDEDGRITGQDILPFLVPVPQRNDGIDNDGDASLVGESNPTNNVDDDGDGLVDETGIDQRDEQVMRANYDGDATRLVGADGQFGTADDDPEDVYLSQFDLNENGLLDEIALDPMPGVATVDDDDDRNDIDGGEQFADNGIDDDDDGLIDETGIDLRDEEVMRADYDGDGIQMAGPDGQFGTADDDLDDRLLAAFDSNENGGLSDVEKAVAFRPIPGAEGVDDEGDALADAESNTTDGIDNDGDGLVDETGIDLHDVDVMRADYDDDGYTLAGDDGKVGTADDDPHDLMLAAFDDDENGYLDDFNGFNFSIAYNNDVMDRYGHGSHCAGTIGAVGNNNEGVVGVAWNVKIMPLKILGGQGDPTEVEPLAFMTSAMQALEYAIEMGVKVSNNSYGWSTQHSWPFEALLRRAHAANHVFVAAAGNEGADNDQYDRFPANYDVDNVVSVAATDHSDHLAEFSCYGAKTVDIAAPGVDIYSTIPDGVQPSGGRPLPGTYGYSSGTSMAAPHVAGAVALLLSVAPWATPDMIVTALLDGSRKDKYLVNRVRSAGHLDAYGALRILDASWINIDPMTMTVPAAGQNTAQVTLNVGGRLPASSEPYEADIWVRQGLSYVTVPVALTVTPAPLPRIVGYRIVGDGDGDGFAEPGETIQVEVQLENVGSQFLIGAQGTASSATPGVSLPDNTVSWPNLGGAASRAWSTDTLSIQLDALVSGDVEITFSVDGGSRTWSDDLVLSFNVGTRLSITGTVTDRGGAPVAGAVVEYFGVGAGRTTTETDGTYMIHGFDDGAVGLRVIADGYARSASRVVLGGTNQVENFTLDCPEITLTDAIDAGVNLHNSATVQVEVANAVVDNFTYEYVEMPKRRVALISDTDSLGALKPVLEEMGLVVNYYTNNYEVVYVYDPFYAAWTAVPTAYYSGDDEVIFNHDMVILDLSGENDTGRLLLFEEWMALDDYLTRGGRVMFTGENPLSRPDDTTKLLLAGGSSLDRATVSTAKSTVIRALPWGEFVNVEPGDIVAGEDVQYDLASPENDPGDATVYVRAAEAAKIMAHEPFWGGKVYYWSGNPTGRDWVSEGVWQDLLRGIVIDELAEDVPWLVLGSTGQTISDGTVTNAVILNPSKDLEVGEYEATLVVKGNYAGSEAAAIPVSMTVATPMILAESRSGVVDWMNRPLAGNGGPTSSVFQVILSRDSMINPPRADGSPSGDDRVLGLYPTLEELGRIGAGYEYLPDSGRFKEYFEHSGDVATYVYVRAWDAETIAASVAYGDSALYALRNVYGETHDFGSWVVDRVLGYPGKVGSVSDANGDSVPDGWYISQGLDPRMPVEPLLSRADHLSSFGQFGTGVGRMYNPSSLFVTDKFIFVLDSGNSRIQVWDRVAETLVRTYGSNGNGPGQFSVPDDICADPRPGMNRFAVADTLNHRIQLFTFDPDSGVITYESTFGSYGPAPGQMEDPRGVFIDVLGAIYVADAMNHRIQVFSSDQTFFAQVGSNGSEPGKFIEPEGVCADPYGTIYVADTGNNRVQAFSWVIDHYQLFKVLGSEGTADEQFRQPRDVEIGVDDRVFVVDSGNHRVQIFHSTYEHMLSVGSMGQAAGEFKMPFGCAPVPDSGLLYVADTLNARIQLLHTIVDFDRDGIDDLWERDNGLDNTDSTDWNSDVDGDGVSAIGEYRLGIDPGDIDSDGDEWRDGYELARGFDPGDPQYDILRITGIGASGGAVSVRYMAADGALYRLETSATLGGMWVPVGGSEARASGDGIVSFPYLGGVHAYFRAIRIEE